MCKYCNFVDDIRTRKEDPFSPPFNTGYHPVPLDDGGDPGFINAIFHEHPNYDKNDSYHYKREYDDDKREITWYDNGKYYLSAEYAADEDTSIDPYKIEDIPFTTRGTYIELFYCPFCGRNLKDEQRVTIKYSEQA